MQGLHIFESETKTVIDLESFIPHAQYDFLSMAAVHGKDVIFVKINSLAQVEAMQPSFVQTVVYHGLKPLSVSANDIHPEIFAPSS